MARKKKHGEHANHERWLVSYADFITLLFAFFVVMFASSQTDKAKAQKISDSVTDALDKGGVQAVVHEVLGGTVDDLGKGSAQMKGPGGTVAKDAPNSPPPQPKQELLPKMKYLSDALKEEIKSGKLEIKQEDRGLVIDMQDAAFFPSGNDTVDPKMFESISKIVEIAIKDTPNSILLEGHTDSQPIHTDRFRSNWELSTARGIAMLELLSGKFRVPHERLAVVGYADTVPKDTNETEKGRARNRRVDIVILNERVGVQQTATKPAAPAKAAPAAPENSTEKKPSPAGKKAD